LDTSIDRFYLPGSAYAEAGQEKGRQEVKASIAARLMRLKAAAIYLSMSCKELRLMIERGELEVIKGHDKNSPWRVDIRDLDNWILKNKETL
jgi:hypothetical protein